MVLRKVRCGGGTIRSWGRSNASEPVGNCTAPASTDGGADNGIGGQPVVAGANTNRVGDVRRTTGLSSLW